MAGGPLAVSIACNSGGRADVAVRYVGGFPRYRKPQGVVVIRDETKRVRQPAAWLLLGGVAIDVFLGIMAMLSTGWAGGVNPATLGAVSSGSMAGPTFGDRSAVASHVFTSIPLTAMAVVAVILATHLGEKVRQARRITLYAVVLQAVALLLGVITWLASLGVPHGAARLAFLFDGAIGVMIATAGLFFSTVTLRSRELQAARTKRTRQAMPQQAVAYPGYGYGQQGVAGGAGSSGAAHGYPAGYQSGSAQHAAAQQAQQYPAAASQQYPSSAAQQYGQSQGQTQASDGQPSYGSDGQQAIPQVPLASRATPSPATSRVTTRVTVNSSTARVTGPTPLSLATASRRQVTPTSGRAPTLTSRALTPTSRAPTPISNRAPRPTSSAPTPISNRAPRPTSRAPTPISNRPPRPTSSTTSSLHTSRWSARRTTHSRGTPWTTGTHAISGSGA